jgi:hypothetical protein
MLQSSDFSSTFVDLWRAAQPTVTSLVGLSTTPGPSWVGGRIEVSPHIMALPMALEVLEAFFVNPSDPQQRVACPRWVPVLESAGGSFALVEDRVRIFTFRGTDAASEFVHPTGATRIVFEAPPIPGTAFYDLEVFQPYHWHERDLAEILFAWTRNYISTAGLDPTDELDETTFVDYSLRNRDPFRRQQFTVWRRTDTSFADLARSLLQQSNAIATFGRHEAGSALSFPLRLFEFTEREISSTAINLDDGRDVFAVSNPSLRFANEDVANRLALPWGTGVEIGNLTSGREQYTTAGSSPLSAPEEQNKLDDELALSQSSYGVREVRLAPRINLNTEQWAEGSLDLTRWADLRREIEFTIGPLHFDFNVGDVVNVTDDVLDLDGTEELLVTEKTYDWDSLFSIVRAKEIVPDATVSKTPSQVDDDEDAELILHLDANVGVFTSSGNDVSGWVNLAGGPICSFLGAGTSLPPQLRTNGVTLPDGSFRDMVDFQPSGGNPRSLLIPSTFFSTDDASFTFLALGQFYRTSGASSQKLLESNGRIGGNGFALSALNGSTGRTGFVYNSALSLGPQMAENRVHLLAWQLYRSRGNYSRAGEERTWVRSEALSLSPGLRFTQARHDVGNTGVGETSLAFPYGDHADVSNPIELGSMDFPIILGSASDSTNAPGNFDLWEMIGFRHDKGDRPLRTRSLRGLRRYLLDRWGFEDTE